MALQPRPVPPTTSTNLQARGQPIPLQITFVVLIGVVEVALLLGEWKLGKLDHAHAGYDVAAGATAPVALLFVAALINWIAAWSKRPYLWVLPNVVRVRAPDILVGIGFVVGFILGILFWT